MGFLHLPVRVPLRRNFRSVPSPFRGGFFVIACFDFIAYFLGGSKYVVITFRVATSTSLPPLKGEVAALADGEVLCSTKNFAYIMTERFQWYNRYICPRNFSFRKKGCEKCADPKKLDQKSNFWRSVFLWQNTLLSLRKK